MERSGTKVWLAAGLLIAAGVAVRLTFRDIPNFAPVAGLALFSGFVFRSAAVAAAVPLGIMLLSDQILGGYTLPIQLTVYACLTLPVLLRRPLRYCARRSTIGPRGVLALAGAVGASALGCSLLFFVATNGAVWLFGSWYEASWQGLIQCYINALPFFRYTLAGDLLFAASLFSTWGVVTYLKQASQAADTALAR